jgi:2-keto-4-pentenoate hydratase
MGREIMGGQYQMSAGDNSAGMTMSQHDIETLARELLSAYETGEMVAVAPSARPGFDLNAAYEVEAILKQLREAAGHKAVGRKVGYANKAMWRALKLETLAWAHMYDDTVHYSTGNDAALAVKHPRSLRVEPEIVFGLKKPVVGENAGGNAVAPDALSALGCAQWLAIGFEIIDIPFPHGQFQAVDFVASFGLHAALLVGERVYVNSNNIGALVDELARFTVRVSKNGEFVEEGAGRNCLRSPALCLAELSAAIAKRFPDEPLSVGEVVSSGTLTGGHPASGGDVWTVDVQGLSVPSLTLRLS